MKSPRFANGYYEFLAVRDGERVPAGYVLFRRVLYILSKLLLCVKTPEIGGMPQEPPLILAFNHIHFLDPHILTKISEVQRTDIESQKLRESGHR